MTPFSAKNLVLRLKNLSALKKYTEKLKTMLVSRRQPMMILNPTIIELSAALIIILQRAFA